MPHIAKTLHSIRNLSSVTASQQPLEASFLLELPVTPPLYDLSTPITINGQLDAPALFADLKRRIPITSVKQNNTDSDDVHKDSIHQPMTVEIGVDEVGRGPLYGSVVVSAVVLPYAYSGAIEDDLLQDTPLKILTDSKKLTAAKRERLFPLIQQVALAHLTVDVPASVIDEINILQATLLGMRLACEHIMTEMTALSVGTMAINPLSSDGSINSLNLLDNIQFKLLIDGNKTPPLDWQHLASQGLGNALGDKVMAETWIKGDARHTAIAAASVLAKVTRDRQMVKEAISYPDYGLQSHKGYPTKSHIEAIKRLGVLPQHRRSFKPIREALDKSLK